MAARAIGGVGMSELVTLIDGEAVTTSLAIAEGTGVSHQSVRELIQDRSVELEGFGVLRFETGEPSELGGRPQKYALLSEPQATLLLTFMRNSEVVVRFKVALVRAFFELRERAANPGAELTRREILVMAIEAEDRADRERAARLEAEVRALELAAPASAWAHMAAAAGDYAVSDAAKILSRDPAISIGRDRLFVFMSGIGWVYRAQDRRKSWTAYQTQVNCERLVEKMGKPYLNEKTGETELPAPTVRITAKGLAELHKRLGGTKPVASLAVAS